MGKVLNCGHADCVYHVSMGSTAQPMCAYILIEKHSRGCKVNPDCNKYKKGQRKKKIDYSTGIVVYDVEPDEAEIEIINEYEVKVNEVD